MYSNAVEIHIYEIGSETDRLIRLLDASNPQSSGYSETTGDIEDTSSSEETETADTALSPHTVQQQPPSKRTRVCSSPVACTDTAIGYMCHWKVITTAKAVLEMLYGAVTTIVNNELAYCIVPDGLLS